MADDDLLGDAELVEQRGEAEAERLHAHQVDLALVEPARVVFAKAGRLDHRPRFVVVGVGLEFGLRLGEQMRLSAGRGRPCLADRGAEQKGRGAYWRNTSMPLRCSTLTSRLRKLAPSRLIVEAPGGITTAWTSSI